MIPTTALTLKFLIAFSIDAVVADVTDWFDRSRWLNIPGGLRTLPDQT